MIRKLISRLFATPVQRWSFAAALALPIAIGVCANVVITGMIDSENVRHDKLVQEIYELDKSITEISHLEEEVAFIIDLSHAADQLQVRAYRLALMLAELSRLPVGLSVRRMEMQKNRMVVTGVARDLLVIGGAAEAVREADEIAEVIIADSTRLGNDTYSFTLRATVSDEQPAAEL
jgi:Tfp pilus assembly protein PilN